MTARRRQASVSGERGEEGRRTDARTEMAENISVCVRVRPLNDKEKKVKSALGWVVDHSGTNIAQVHHKANERKRASSASEGLPTTATTAGDEHKYSFDKIYDETWGTKHIYEDVCVPVVDSVVEGFNGTIFAYGQTSSGKTYTMRGSATWEDHDATSQASPSARRGSSLPSVREDEVEAGTFDDEEFGILPLAIRGIFQRIRNTPGRQFLLRISYMEIYNEDIIDLLAHTETGGSDQPARGSGQSGRGDGNSGSRRLLVKESPNGGGPYVCGLREEIVRSEKEVAAWLKKGDIHRHVGETKMNRNSSRSHTLFQMVIESRESARQSSGPGDPTSAGAGAEAGGDGGILVSKLTLVDLAGSERLSKTMAEGRRAKEGAYINKSLLTLGTVINKLYEGQHKHIPYRDSKLTRILQTALGGNSKTAMITNITPSVLHMDETHSTLRFATRTKSVKNNAVVNEVVNDDALLKRQQKEIERLRSRLQERNKGVDIEATEAAIKDMKDHLIEVTEQNKSIEEMLQLERTEKQNMQTDLRQKAKKLQNLTTFMSIQKDPGSKEAKKKRSKKGRMSLNPNMLPSVRPADLLAEIEKEKKAASNRSFDDLQIQVMRRTSAISLDQRRQGTTESKLFQEALARMRSDLTLAKESVESRDRDLEKASLREKDLRSSLSLIEVERAGVEEDLAWSEAQRRKEQEEAAALFRTAKEAQEAQAHAVEAFVAKISGDFQSLSREVEVLGRSLEENEALVGRQKAALAEAHRALGEANQRSKADREALSASQRQVADLKEAAKSKSRDHLLLEETQEETLSLLSEERERATILQTRMADLEHIQAESRAAVASLEEERAAKAESLRALGARLEAKESALQRAEEDKQRALRVEEDLAEAKGQAQRDASDRRAALKRAEEAERALARQEALVEAYQEKARKFETLLHESERKAAHQEDLGKKVEKRMQSLTERLNAAVGSQSKLSEDLRVSREEKIGASRRERQMEARLEEAEERVHERDRIVCEYEVKVATLEADMATLRQKNSETKAKTSEVRAELMAENAELRDKAEALERKVTKMEVMKGSDPSESKDHRMLVLSLQNEVKSTASECRYWKQQTKELTEAKVKIQEKKDHNIDRVARLEQEQESLASSLELAQDRADDLALQIADLNAQVSAANSKFEQYKTLDPRSVKQFGEEVNRLEPKQLVVIESQGGITRMIDSFMQNRRRMAKLQAVYNDMKSKVSRLDKGEEVFDNLKSVSELEYDLHYMANKKKTFESKYNDLRRQVQETRRNIGKENLTSPSKLL